MNGLAEISERRNTKKPELFATDVGNKCTARDEFNVVAQNDEIDDDLLAEGAASGDEFYIVVKCDLKSFMAAEQDSDGGKQLRVLTSTTVSGRC